jgi:iron complex transport system ATP-binding protein
LIASVDLDLRAGELVVLVGPNGAGKTTLVRALTGDVLLSTGTVLLGSRPAHELSAVEQARHRAVLPQRTELAFPFTVEEVVAMGRAPWSGVASMGEDHDAVEGALAACDLGSLRRRPYPTLSGGEQARTMLARVLAQRAGLLLLDEPTGALDIQHQEQVFAVLRERVRQGDAVVVVVHDLTAAAAHADRVVVLQAGRVVVDAPPATALDPDLLTRVYGHPVEVVTSPRSGALAVLPLRPATPQGAS